MYCSNCGMAIGDRTNNCPKCGVKPFRTNSYCYSCGSKNLKKSQEQCVSCGTNLNQPIVVIAPTEMNYSWFTSFQASIRSVMVKLKRE